jgi:hypothetical protein
LSDTGRELHFDGTDGTIRFATRDLAAEFLEVVHAWPARSVNEAGCPYAEIRDENGQWRLSILRPEPREQSHSPVNGICDLVVELNWSRLRQQPDLMCLHAGGIEMAGRLVVFPSGRRAGKSTLCAEMTRRGYRLFSDDVLAVCLAEGGMPSGIATGIAPRLRLPVPPDASEGFHRWVKVSAGPANRQYKYLTTAPVAAYGATVPLGAIVTLERVDEDVEPVLEDMDPNEVVPVLIRQNFGRFVHSGHALATFGAIARGLPCLKLTYRRFEQAADYLEDAFRAGRLSGDALAATTSAGAARLEDRDAAPFDPALPYRRRKGCTVIEVEGEAYVADASGIGIYHLNPGMIPIWHLLEEPVEAAEIVNILADLHPQTGTETLSRDVDAALRMLAGASLIEAAASRKTPP